MSNHQSYLQWPFSSGISDLDFQVTRLKQHKRITILALWKNVTNTSSRAQKEITQIKNINDWVLALKWMKYMESNISNTHSNPEIHTAPHNSDTGNRVLIFKTVCRQQICESMQQKPITTLIWSNMGAITMPIKTCPQNTFILRWVTNTTQSSINQRMCSLFKDKIGHQNLYPVNWIHKRGVVKKLTHPQLIINAAFFINKNPYVSRRLDINVTILMNEMHGTGTSHTFRKIQTSTTLYAAPPVLQPEYYL